MVSRSGELGPADDCCLRSRPGAP